MNEVSVFLATCPVFSGMSTKEIEELASVFRTAHHPAGTILLKQGGYSDAIYFLKSGRLAVRIQRGAERDTVAMLQPTDAFGELSFLTGKQCVADVEVVVDSDVVFLPREALPEEGPKRDAVMRGLLGALATRLQVTMQRGATAIEPPVVLLRNSPNWKAPQAFAGELVKSLARQTDFPSLVLNIGTPVARDLTETGSNTAVIDIAAEGNGAGIRPVIAKRLDELHSFHNILLNPVGPAAAAIADQIEGLCNFRGYLLGPGDPIPDFAPDEKVQEFCVQMAEQPTLPDLSGSRQLIREAARSEDAFLRHERVTQAFQHTVDSIARRIAGLQVGLALGGGAAWGWAHIGILGALEEAGLPIDMIAGCSMGSVIGSLYASGHSVSDLLGIADYWRDRTIRLIEWQVWRLQMVNERALKKVLAGYFGARAVNQTNIPFWANAVDIESGSEYAMKDGPLVQCIRGSISLPGLLSPFARPPRLLVDAGIMNPVPAVLLREMGCNYAVAINAMAAPGTTPVSARYPFNAISLMLKCMFVMGHEIGQRAEQAANIVFTPDLSGISLLQFKRSAEIIDRGRRAAEERLPTIMAGYARLKEAMRQHEIDKSTRAG